jgi:signal transduction histidine kinase
LFHFTIVTIAGDFKVSFIHLSAIFFILIPALLFNFFGKTSLARWFFFLFGLATAVFLSYFNINRRFFVDTQVVIFASASIGLFLFSGYELLIAFSAALTGYFFIWYLEYKALLEGLNVPFRQFTNPLTTFILIFIVFVFYKKVRNRFENKVISQKQDLETINEELRSQAEEIYIINEALEEQKKQLEEANATKDRLFSIIAHDLKVPFRTLKSMFDLMEISDLTNEDKDFFIKKIKQYNQDTAHLLDNLLLWSRNQMSSESIKPQEFVLTSEVKNCLVLFQEVASNKKINIQIEYSDSFVVWADIHMTQFIIRNLISNAIKFSNSESSIIIKTYLSENYGILEVQDFGIGMTQGKVANIFKLSHERSLGTEKEVGTGLGLPLCKIYIEKNKGEISVESQEGIGSKFLVKFQLSNSIVQKS